MKYILLLLVFLPLSSYANEQPAICKLLVKHTPAADVVYKPGVDVKGRVVTPADLNPSQIAVPDVIKVPVTVDLAQRLQASNVTGLQLETGFDAVEIHKDGKVIYQGRDLTQNVNALCGISGKVIVEISQIPTADRQEKPNTLNSNALDVKPTQAIPPQDVYLQGGDFREEGYR